MLKFKHTGLSSLSSNQTTPGDHMKKTAKLCDVSSIRKRDAVTESWVRAKKLVELARCGTPKTARAFLSINKKTIYHRFTNITILDNPILDKRNHGIRSLIEEYTKFSGGLNIQHCVKLSIPKSDKSTHPSNGDPASPRESESGFTILLELRQIQQKHELTISDLTHYTKILGDLTDSP